MVLPELTTYLAAYSPSLGLTGGTNLFYGIMPPTPDLCVALFEYGSTPPEITVGATVIGFEDPRIQVRVRGVKDDYDTPRLLLNKIVEALVKIQEQTLSGTQYHAVLPKQSPFMLLMDDNFRLTFACNFEVTKDWSST